MTPEKYEQWQLACIAFPDALISIDYHMITATHKKFGNRELWHFSEPLPSDKVLTALFNKIKSEPHRVIGCDGAGELIDGLQVWDAFCRYHKIVPGHF